MTKINIKSQLSSTFTHSLRWRLLGAFSLIILITIVLSALLSIWTTTNRFQILITDEGQAQAEEIAPLLEAIYARRGNWSALDELIITKTVDFDSPLDLFEEPWHSNIDWWQVTANTLNISPNLLYEYHYDFGSLAAIAEENNIDPNTLIIAIVDAEKAAIEDAINRDLIFPDEKDSILNTIKEEASTFVWEDISEIDLLEVDWEEIIAHELNMSLDELFEAVYNQEISVAELAAEQNISLQQLVDAIVNSEVQAAQAYNLPIDDSFKSEVAQSAAEWIALELTPVVFSDQIYQSQPNNNDSFSFSEEGISWLINALLPLDQRLLVTDPDGQVIYDSTTTDKGEFLPDSALIQAVTLWDYSNPVPKLIGLVLIADDPDAYTTQQLTFLQSVTTALIGGGLITGVIALLIALLIAQRFIAPIKALTQATHRLANGEQTTPLPVNSTDELGQMSDAFNKMTRALATQQALRQRLIDDVAHELKTPLSVIQLELEAAQDGFQTLDEATTRVQHEITLLHNLVEDLTWLAETDKGIIHLNRQPTDLVQLTQNAVSRWQPKANATNITLKLLSTSPLPTISLDPLRISQVLGNLINNALQHTPPNGSIEIKLTQELHPASSSQPTSTPYLVTTISDTGQGIPPQDLPHIFNRFYRADPSRNRHTGGRGLGLAIVHQIIQLHGGQVWVDSTLGQGSVFGYRLPLDTNY